MQEIFKCKYCGSACCNDPSDQYTTPAGYCDYYTHNLEGFPKIQAWKYPAHWSEGKWYSAQYLDLGPYPDDYFANIEAGWIPLIKLEDVE